MGNSDVLAAELAQIELDQAALKQVRPHDFFRPLPGGQRRFWESPLKEKHLFGANQAGKTITLVNYILRRCKEKPGSRWYVGSTSMDRSRKVTQKNFWLWVNKDEIADSVKYTEDEGFRNDCLVMKCGSIVFFLSYEMEQDKWASDTLDGVGFDEEPPWHVFTEAQKRIIARDGELISAMTALKSFTRFVNRVYLSGDPKIGIYTVPLHENHVRVGGIFTDLRLQQIYYDTPESERPSRIFGIPTYKTGLIYDEWKDEFPWVIAKKDEFEIPAYWTRYCAIDPHGSLPHAIACIAVSPEGRMFQYKEVWEKCLIPELARKIRRLATPYDFEAILIDNHYSTQANSESGKTIKQLLFEYGEIMTIGGCDDVMARIDMLKAWDRINPATKLPMLQVFESCERTRWERKRYEWQSPISERVAERRDAKPVPKAKDGHLMNCLEYLAAHGGRMGLEYAVPLPSKHIAERQKFYEERRKEEIESEFDGDEPSGSMSETVSYLYE